MDILKLVKPSMEHEEQVMAYREEMLQNGDSLDGCAKLEEVRNYAEWLDFEGRLSAAYGDGYVPSYVYLAIRVSDGRLVGIVDYRTPLTEFLLNFGGNIGYSVRPSERRKGYAKEILRQCLEICREKGEHRVLVTCDKGNTGSQKTILANGGVLENEVEDRAGLSRSGIIERYWIELQ